MSKKNIGAGFVSFICDAMADDPKTVWNLQNLLEISEKQFGKVNTEKTRRWKISHTFLKGQVKYGCQRISHNAYQYVGGPDTESALAEKTTKVTRKVRRKTRRKANPVNNSIQQKVTLLESVAKEMGTSLNEVTQHLFSKFVESRA